MLHRANVYKNKAALEFLLEHLKHLINKQDNSGNNPIRAYAQRFIGERGFYSVYGSDLEIFDLLLVNGADPYLANRDGESAAGLFANGGKVQGFREVRQKFRIWRLRNEPRLKKLIFLSCKHPRLGDESLAKDVPMHLIQQICNYFD